MVSLDVDAKSPPLAGGKQVERRLTWRRLALGLCLALGGIALSLWLSWHWRAQEQELAQLQFRRDAKERIEELQRIVTARLAAVSAAAAFVRSADVNDRKHFATFVNQVLPRQPGMQLLAWAPRVPANKRRAHEQALRTEGFPKYAICQQGGPRQLVVAGERDDYYPIIFLEPEKDTQIPLGYDLGSEAAFRAACHDAIAGRPAVMNTSLGYGKEDDHSVLCVIEPAGRESVSPAARPADPAETDAFVVGVFRMGELVENALDLFAPAGIDVCVARPADKGKTVPVYTRLAASHGTLAGQTADDLHFTGPLEVGDSRWTVNCAPTATYLDQYQSWGPPGILLAGLCITALLLGYLFLLPARAAAAERTIADR
jgi:CHASE1-domain containing sensor protein